MKDCTKGRKKVCFMDEKPKDEKLKDEHGHKVSITELHHKVNILEVSSRLPR